VSIEVVQHCDRCKKWRIIGNLVLSSTATEAGGWRQVKLSPTLAENEQPWLCPHCVVAVYEFIQQGVNVDASPS
jgi:hypothetical protein